MKKSLLAMLLAVALVAPVFAVEKGAMQLDIKAGIPISQKLKIEYKEYNVNLDSDMKQTFSLGADFFYYVGSNIAVGAGIDHIFNSEIKYDLGTPVTDKLGYTNIYVQAKYDFILNNDFFNNIYPIVQIGYGILHENFDKSDYVPSDMSYESENGLYWAIGVGTTIKENFIVELIYSFDYGKVTSKSSFMSPTIVTMDLTYKILKLNLGYKFSL